MGPRADDDVIVKRDAERLAGIGEFACQGDILAARARVARRMVVNQQQRRGVEVDRPADDLADIDRRLVDRSLADQLVADQHVLGVEIEAADALYGQVPHVGLEIVEQRLPVGEHRLLADLAGEQAERGGPGDHQRADRSVAEAGGALDRFGRRGEQRSVTAEFGEQFFRQRLGVAAGDGEGEEIFDQLVIEQRLVTALEQPLAQPRAVAGAVGGSVRHGGHAIGMAAGVQSR